MSPSVPDESARLDGKDDPRGAGIDRSSVGVTRAERRGTTIDADCIEADSG